MLKKAQVIFKKEQLKVNLPCQIYVCNSEISIKI